ncbi:hypothetical protein JCM3774_004710 [Rhodotorula dairenensis]
MPSDRLAPPPSLEGSAASAADAMCLRFDSQARCAALRDEYGSGRQEPSVARDDVVRPPSPTRSSSSRRLALPTGAAGPATGSGAADKPKKRQRRRVPPEERLAVRGLRCRPPPPPPPAPPLAAVALPFLLARHPRLPLIRPSTKKPSSRTRIRSRSLSVTPVPTRPSSANKNSTPLDGNDLHAATNSSDEIEARWHDLVPALVDMPHLDSSDVESVDGTDRRYRPDRDPLGFKIQSFEPDLARRPLKPCTVTQYKLVPMEPRPGRYTLPHPFDRGPMLRADAEAAREAALAAERRAARKQKRKRNSKDQSADADPPARLPKKLKTRREAENEALQRLRRLDTGSAEKQADPDLSDSDSDSDSHVSDSEGEPTIGFLALARRVLREQRKRRRRRRAEGRNSAAETTDDEHDDKTGRPSFPQY